MPSFRKAEEQDLPLIMEVFREAQAFIRTLSIDQWQDGYPEKDLIREDIAEGQAWVIDDMGAIAAVEIISCGQEPFYAILDTAGSSGGAGWLTGEGEYATMHRMAVNDRHRHSGLAAELLRSAEEMCRERGVRSLRTDTHRGNAPMRRFLAKNGFTLCGEVVYSIARGDKIRVAYEKILRP